MEGKFGGKPQYFYGPTVSDLKAADMKTVEWDLNDWKWDGDLFTATPLNPVPSDCRSRQLFPDGPETAPNAGSSHSSSSCSEHSSPGNEKGKRKMRNKKRAVVVLDDDDDDDEVKGDAGSLKLQLGGQVYPMMDEDAKCGKKTKVTGTPCRSVCQVAVCQVEDCRADLSKAKDYHRRHKVCDVHSKATKAMVGNVMQRFCQQCSRWVIFYYICVFVCVCEVYTTKNLHLKNIDYDPDLGHYILLCECISHIIIFNFLFSLDALKISPCCRKLFVLHLDATCLKLMGRFHVLQEFDEGKRSCRRRLAGHNQRRRKTHPDNLPTANSLNDERNSSFLLISLLRILSNMHCKYLL